MSAWDGMDPQGMDEWFENDLDDFENPPKQGPKDARHDQFLVPLDANLIVTAGRIFAHLESTFPRPSKQRTDARDRRKAIVENLVASLTLLVLHHPHGTAMGMSRHTGERTRYNPLRFPEKAFWQLVGEMQKAGYLEWVPGSRRRHTALMWPTEKFRSQLPPLGTKPLALVPGAETIILKTYNQEHTSKRVSDYLDNANTSRMRKEMAAINAMLADGDIRIDGRPIPPQRLVRIFLTGATGPNRFQAHGRLYHGVWQNMPREDRWRLTINGERCCDLDFKAMHLSMVYIQHGLPPPLGDPYDIPAFVGHREGVKRAVASLFHRPHGTIKRLSPELAALLPEGMDAKTLMNILTIHHPPLGNLRPEPIGEFLTFIESRLMVLVVLSLADQGVISLPSHDGLLCAASHRDMAVQAMRDASRLMLGVELPIAEKIISGGFHDFRKAQ